MNKIKIIENYINAKNNNYGLFLIEPLNIGYGLTIGNSLRRVLLSELTSYSTFGFCLNNIKHEFSTLLNIREDIFDLILNLKQIIFKESFYNLKINSNNFHNLFINIKGPKIITASLLNLPKNYLKIINPNQYICTLLDNSNFYLNLYIKKQKGYIYSEDNKNQFLNNENKSIIFIDSNFNPIKNVNFKIKLIHDSFGNIKESLIIEIFTNGSITPFRSLCESIKLLLKTYSSLLIFDNLYYNLK